MELTYLYYFKVIAEKENMSRAAETLHVSQPALSKTISKLETSLGVTLFERKKGRISLSPIGQEFYRQVARAFDCLDEGQRIIDAYKASSSSTVTIGCPVADLLNKRGHRVTIYEREDRAGGLLMTPTGSARCTDILPEEIPLQREMERAIAGALRDGQRAEDVATTLRLLCKQGAPLDALEDVLQTALIVYVSDAMRAALSDLYFQTPKWVISAGSETLQ